MKYQVLLSLKNNGKKYSRLSSAAVVMGALKVGSCCFKCIVTLLIYFLNCR